LLETGRLDVCPIITHEMPLDGYQEGFALLEAGKGSKVILVP
jgi:threonine 3-dehydrogenase